MSNKIHVQICFACDANLERVKEQLEELVTNHPEFRFHHCFLARHHVEEKGFDMAIVDMLDEVLGENQYRHLEDYETFSDAMSHLEEKRELVADLVNRMFVLDAGAAKGIAREIELFTRMKVVLLP